MNKPKAAVIGIGGIGIWHGQMLRDTQRMDVVALCDANESMRTRAKEHFPDARFYTAPEQMLSQERPGVVVLATPHDLHAPLAIAALGAGANVIVEKPMATRYEDCLAMIAAARKADRFLTVFHNRRLDGWYLAAKSVIDDGVLGRLIELNSAITFRPGPETWRGYKAKCGGIMFDWGVHLVDYVVHLGGGDVRAVSGFYYRAPGANPALNEDHGHVRIHFQSGAIANVTIYAMGRGSPLRYHITGERGTLTDEWNWDDNQKVKVLTTLSAGTAASMEVSYHKTVTQRFYDNVADHVENGAPLLVSAESAARNINILCTAERAFAQGGAPLPLA